ncbi:MAG TPA: type II secretion system protein [bacterium]|nr:type II secretion system protein [bacterium]
MSSNRLHRGFTMLEMLVVATIVAILITMGLSSYRASRQRAIEVAGFHGMKVLSAAQEAYMTSYGRYARYFNELKGYSIIAREYQTNAAGIDAFMKGFSVVFMPSTSPYRFSIVAVGRDYPHNPVTGDRLIFRLTQEGLVQETRAGTSGTGGTYVPAH